MSLSMHQASVPVFVRALNNLSAILEKGEASCAARKIDPAVLLADRLAPDMFPLARQVQIACDSTVRGAARLAGRDIPSMPDVETSFAELRERIAKAIAFVESVPAGEIDGSEGKTVTIPLRDGERTFTGQDFLLGFALPNLYFHITATYLILRHNGVELGKADFLAGGVKA